MSDEAKFGVNTADSSSVQPKPAATELSKSVTDGVVSDLQARREYGRRKYDVELLSHNGRDPLLDAYQEALDLCMYLKQTLMERQRGSPTRSYDTCGCEMLEVAVGEWRTMHALATCRIGRPFSVVERVVDGR